MKNKRSKAKAKPSVEKSDRAIKQSFNNGLLTIKFQISQLQMKNGKTPNFALFVEDNVHDPESKPAKETAGRVIAFAEGDLREDFLNGGIKFDPFSFLGIV